MEKVNFANYRTDLALEARELVSTRESRVRGVRVSEEEDLSNNINIVRMEVLNRTGARLIGRPTGRYVTIETDKLQVSDEDYHREISVIIAREIKNMIINLYQWEDQTPHVLIAGLGNRDATPDSLGPRVVSNLMITRHIVEYMGYDEIEGAFAITSALIPGVMAQTGMDTSEIVSAIVRKTRPDVLIVVDALAARNVKRLNSTIQITDTGILPGSGVGNNRNEITKKTMGIPVIAVGVPTVVDAQAFAHDEENKDMYVTSKDIDAIIKRVSYTLSEGINICMGLGGVVKNHEV